MNLKQIKDLAGARKAAMPEFVPPQLATLIDKPPSGEEWFHELKFDGYRLLCHLEGRQVRFWTRNRKDWTAKFANVGKEIKSLPVRSSRSTVRDARVFSGCNSRSTKAVVRLSSFISSI